MAKFNFSLILLINPNQVIAKALGFLNNPHERIDLKTDDLFQIIIDNFYDLGKNGK